MKVIKMSDNTRFKIKKLKQEKYLIAGETLQ